MRTTVTLDDELLRAASESTGIKETSVLIRHALEQVIRQEAARRLRLLGGTDPEAEAGPRCRGES